MDKLKDKLHDGKSHDSRATGTPQDKKDSEHHGIHGLIDGIKDKINDTNLHDVKVSLSHKKSVP